MEATKLTVSVKREFSRTDSLGLEHHKVWLEIYSRECRGG
jgi:hypothetical protein